MLEIAASGGIERWQERRENMTMDVLAFLARYGYQDANAIARDRPLAWSIRLAKRVGRLMELESEAMRKASKGGR